jgi:hypothetical protein
MDPEIQKFIPMLGSPRVLTANVNTVAKAKIHLTPPTPWEVLVAKSCRTAKAISKKGEFRGDVTPVAIT